MWDIERCIDCEVGVLTKVSGYMFYSFAADTDHLDVSSCFINKGGRTTHSVGAVEVYCLTRSVDQFHDSLVCFLTNTQLVACLWRLDVCEDLISCELIWYMWRSDICEDLTLVKTILVKAHICDFYENFETQRRWIFNDECIFMENLLCMKTIWLFMTS